MNNIQNPWDLIAEEYAASFGEEGDYLHKYIIYPTLNNLLDEVKNREVLDMGCGSGTLTRLLVRQGAHLTGIDFSSEMIRIAQESSKNLDLKYMVSDVTKDIALPNESFDIVLQVMLLHTLGSIDNAVEESARLLKKEGTCITVVPHPFFCRTEFKSLKLEDNGSYFDQVKGEFTWSKLVDICQSPTSFYLRSLEFYTQKFKKAGFVVDSIIEPRIIESVDAERERPLLYAKRLNTPSFMLIKWLKY